MGFRFLAAIAVMALLSWAICRMLITPGRLALDEYDQEARAYVKPAVLAIVRNWDQQEWEHRAAIELREARPISAVKADFKKFRDVLGPIRKVEEPIGDASIEDVRGVEYPVGAYSVGLQFKRGYATLGVIVVKKGGGWKFREFALRGRSINKD